MDPTKESFYVLRVVCSRPHSEGIEYWFRKTAVDIVECIETWMFDYESFSIALVQLDNPYHIFIDEFDMEDKEELKTIKEKAIEIDKKFKHLYNSDLNESEKNFRVCHDCLIFTEKDICFKCQDPTHDTES